MLNLPVLQIFDQRNKMMCVVVAAIKAIFSVLWLKKGRKIVHFEYQKKIANYLPFFRELQQKILWITAFAWNSEKMIWSNILQCNTLQNILNLAWRNSKLDWLFRYFVFKTFKSHNLQTWQLLENMNQIQNCLFFTKQWHLSYFLTEKDGIC